jgi:hypothetical protein
MLDLAAVTAFDHVLEPCAGGGRLIAKLPRRQEITAIEIDPTKAAHLAMMPHSRDGGMSVSQTNFLDHVGKGAGYFGTFFDAILMTPPRHQNQDLRRVLAVWDCLAPGGTLVGRGSIQNSIRVAPLPWADRKAAMSRLPVNLRTGTRGPCETRVASISGRLTRSNFQMNASTLASFPIRGASPRLNTRVITKHRTVSSVPAKSP